MATGTSSGVGKAAGVGVGEAVGVGVGKAVAVGVGEAVHPLADHCLRAARLAGPGEQPDRRIALLIGGEG